MATDRDAPPVAVDDDDAGERVRRFVEAFAEGWRAPADADTLTDFFEPWLHPDYRFTQPLIHSSGAGPAAFRETFARPLFQVFSEMRGTVESWAHRGDEVFIALRLEVRIGRRRATLRVCDRLTLVDGRAAERFTYADMLPLLPAIARTPRLWGRVLRWQLDARRAARRAK